jgi:3-oxoacyl-ACP reductase-like protein
MGIFSKIKEAIFGKKAVAAEPKPAIPLEAAPATPAATPEPVAISEVDVEAILTAEAAKHGEELNWRTSIVDLMKLLDIDSSYANRKELAEELEIDGYEGSAEDNIRLHRLVMQALAENGGKVPAEFID